MAADPNVPTVEVVKQELQTAEKQVHEGGFIGFAKALADRFEVKSKGALTSRGLYQLAMEAQEFDTVCKARIKQIETKMGPLVQSAFQTHRGLTALVAELKAGAEQGRAAAARITATYDRVRNAEIEAENARKRAAAEAIEREKRDREAAEAKRLADEAAAREAQARREAEEAKAKGDREAAARAAQEAESAASEAAISNATAEQIKAQPIVAAFVPVSSDKGKIAGRSTSFKKKGAVIPYSEANHRENNYRPDALELIGWLVKHPDAIGELVDWKQSGIDRKLNNGVHLPGVDVTEAEDTRNTSRGGK